VPINGFRWSTSIFLCQQSRRTMENEKIIQNVCIRRKSLDLYKILSSPSLFFLVNSIIDDVAGKKI
jgi:hypothetical protein